MKTEKNTPLINSEGEARELQQSDFTQMKSLQETMPDDFVNMVLAHQAKMEKQGHIKPKVRGKQKTPTKQIITIRLSPEVIEAFKSTGKGWQSRINEVLLQHIHSV
ncbi:BrnA antitoxin family protein [Avibacterium avium]|uniref:BrnA antitoxin family protein n=1 Tax=Avibacterium avium TaxID=751 RepID=UPI003BF8D189